MLHFRSMTRVASVTEQLYRIRYTWPRFKGWGILPIAAHKAYCTCFSIQSRDAPYPPPCLRAAQRKHEIKCLFLWLACGNRGEVR